MGLHGVLRNISTRPAGYRRLVPPASTSASASSTLTDHRPVASSSRPKKLIWVLIKRASGRVAKVLGIRLFRSAHHHHQHSASSKRVTLGWRVVKKSSPFLAAPRKVAAALYAEILRVAVSSSYHPGGGLLFSSHWGLPVLCQQLR